MGVTPKGQAAPQTLILSPENVRAYFESQPAPGRTERYKQLDRYEAFYRGLEYDRQGLDWWGKPADNAETISPANDAPPGFVSTDNANDLSVRDKRPTAPSRLARTITKRFTALLFSKKRLPKIQCPTNPDDEAFFKAIVKQTRFWAKWRTARNKGGGCGSVAVTIVVREGKFVLELHNSKNVSVVWRDRSTWTPLAYLITKLVPIEKAVYDERGNVQGSKMVDILHRRLVTEAEDITYKPVEFDPGAPEIPWEPDEYLYVRHDLGYFPGFWVQNHEEDEDPDGDPDCEGAFQTIDTYDRLVSQMNKGTLNNLDPTLVLGFDAKEVAVQGGVRKGSENSLYVGSKGNAGLMEMAGGGITSGEIVCKILKQQILDLCRCILIDPKDLTGAAQSAKAIELMFGPMLDCADELRDQYENPIVLALEIMARMYRQLHGRPVQVMTPTGPVDALTEITLPARRDGKEHTVSDNPQIEVAWGPYFSPTEMDNQLRITNAVSAKAASLIDQKVGANYTADIFQVDDVEAMLERAREEQSNELDQALTAGLRQVPTTPAAPEDNRPKAAPKVPLMS